MSSSVAVRINDDPSHLRLQYVEEVMQERGVFVDHSTMHYWAMKILQVLAVAFRRRRRPIGLNWHLNNHVEQDHQAVKRITGPMLGFKPFWRARILIAGIKTMHMLQKEQMSCPDGSPMSAADQSYSLAV